MKLSSLLKESVSGKNLVIVDIQPAFEKYIRFNMKDFIIWLNTNGKSYQSIYVLFNGSEQGYVDNWESIKLWYRKNGIKEGVLVRAVDLEKQYGFFRDVMDEGYEDDTILSLARYLIKNQNLHEASDMDFDTIFDVTNDDQLAKSITRGELSFWVPDYLISKLSPISGTIDVVGGAEEQCLSEIVLLLKSLNKDVNIINSWTY